MIRKRLQTSALKIEQLSVGNYTKTKVNIMYLKDIADKKMYVDKTRQKAAKAAKEAEEAATITKDR